MAVGIPLETPGKGELLEFAPARSLRWMTKTYETGIEGAGIYCNSWNFHGKAMVKIEGGIDEGYV